MSVLNLSVSFISVTQSILLPHDFYIAVLYAIYINAYQYLLFLHASIFVCVIILIILCVFLSVYMYIFTGRTIALVLRAKLMFLVAL